MKHLKSTATALQLINEAVDIYSTNNPNELLRRSDELSEQQGDVAAVCALVFRALALERELHFTEAREILEPVLAQLRISATLNIADFLPAINVLCRCYGNIGDSDCLFTLSTEMLQIAERSGNLRQCYSAQRLLGLHHFNTSGYKQALEHFSRALNIAHSLPLGKDILADITELCSRTLQVLGDFETSLSLSLDALILSESVPPDYSRAAIYTNIGSIHAHMRKYSEALEYFHNALDTSRQLQFEYGIAHAEYMIGSMYHNLGAQNLAINHASRALEVAGASRSPQIIHVTGLAYYLLAKVFHLLGNATRSREFATKSLEISNTLQYAEQIAHIRLLLGAVALMEEETKVAITELHIALQIAEQTATKPNILSAHEYLSLAYKQNGDSKQSVYHEEQATILKSVILGNTFNTAYEHFFNTYEATKSKSFATLLGVLDSSELDTLYKSVQYSTESQKAVAKITATTATIVVRTLGIFSVTINDRKITTKDWQRKKARDVFKVLLMYHKRALTTDYIIHMIWNNEAQADALGSFRNAISFIRIALEPNLGRKEVSSYLNSINGAYMLDLGSSAWIDFIAFKELISRAEQTTDISQRLALWEDAITIYNGDFLIEDTSAEWTSFERETITDAFIRALLGVARTSAERGDSEKALHLTKRILSTDRTYEEAYKIMLTVLYNIGNTQEIRRIAQQCKVAFTNENGTEPVWLKPYLT